MSQSSSLSCGKSASPTQKKKIKSPLLSFDRIEWLKKRVNIKNLVDRKIKIKYLAHPSEAPEQKAIKSVFKQFDDNGNHLLETNEVKAKFDDHNLKVDEKTLNKLFKSAAVNRKHDDMCKSLTLYEFAIFSKSDSASQDFKAMMENIKKNTLTTEQEHFLSVEDEAKILPQPSPKSNLFLPSSFNPLMSHFMDEEARAVIRTKIVRNLKNIKIAKDVGLEKNEHLIEENSNIMKRLFKTHFRGKKIVDEEYRKLQTQKKKKIKSLNMKIKKVSDLDVSSFKSMAALDRKIFGGHFDRIPNLKIDLSSIRSKKRREITTLIKTARERGYQEAKMMINNEANTFDTSPLVKSPNSIMVIDISKTMNGSPLFKNRKWVQKDGSPRRSSVESRIVLSRANTNDTFRLSKVNKRVLSAFSSA